MLLEHNGIELKSTTENSKKMYKNLEIKQCISKFHMGQGRCLNRIFEINRTNKSENKIYRMQKKQ